MTGEVPGYLCVNRLRLGLEKKKSLLVKPLTILNCKKSCSSLIADCRIPQIEDAEIRNKTYRHGEKLVIDCHEGFKIRYPDLYNLVSLCRDDGTWDNLPICQGMRWEPLLSLSL